MKYFEGLCYSCDRMAKKVSYEAMGDEERACAVKNVAEAIRQGRDINDTGFMQLLAYCDIDTRSIADAAVEALCDPALFRKACYYPYAIYKDASPEVREWLIAQLLDPECKNANEILCYLAEIGDERVRTVFYQLEHNPLPWRQSLYVDPSVYAQGGGWTFDENGKKIELNYPVCYAIEPQETADSALTVCEKIAGECSVCSSQLVNILVLDGRDERLAFLGIDGQIKLPLCPLCASMSDKTVIRYQVDGAGSFEVVNPFGDQGGFLDEDIALLTNNKLGLSAKPKPLYYAYGFDELSIIGGRPDWVQDWQYEQCPDCGKYMRMMAMLSWAQLQEYGEGNLYIEVCTDCSVAVAFHQQT
ncbi:hypothetical protein KRX19_04940 [Cardiobacteriaceae bacterium TAE3-ERU3]|nr:hypothetical protein [Cardiobacteriaceae bacterium TAE3-ERU3]